jgi:alkylation response protein AidB-like acyl-CoA dehydrogenase
MLLTEEQILIRDSARRFAADHLTPNAAIWDREGQFPAAELKAMGELGFMGMLIPGEWDGAGADHVALALALEEIGAGDGAK